MTDPVSKEATPLAGATLIAGPTGSGKSALGLDLARRSGGVVVNADSLQVYSVLRILTARPDEAETSAVPHRLYGHVDPREPYSAGQWIRDLRRLMAAGAFDGRPAIFVGGTGLYFRALLEGLSAMPEIDETTRRGVRARLAEAGAPALHRVLADLDPASAARIRPEDGQRIARALEVLESSGRPLSAWQAMPGTPLVDAAHARRIVLEPPRPVLVERIERRFDRMMEEGAMEEARAVAALGLAPAASAMKAIGLLDLIAADRGEIGLDEAVARAKAATRRYSKRQATWFRHQLGEGWERVESPAELAPTDSDLSRIGCRD